MWLHFCNLIHQTWQAFLEAEGTTGLGWIGDKIILPIAAFIFSVLTIWGIQGREAVKDHKQRTLGLAFLASLLVFVLWHASVFFWTGIKSVYGDHHDSTGRWQAVVNEKNSLKGVVTARDEYIRQLQVDLNAKPDIVEKTKLISEPKQCWADSVTQGKNQAGHGMALVVVRCNYAVKVPLRVSLEVDRPIANFNFQGIIPEPGDLAAEMSEYPGKDGDRTVWVDIGTLGIPSLPANRLVKFAVESTTSDFPAPIKGVIQSK